jgi:hypothetical protein
MLAAGTANGAPLLERFDELNGKEASSTRSLASTAAPPSQRRNQAKLALWFNVTDCVGVKGTVGLSTTGNTSFGLPRWTKSEQPAADLISDHAYCHGIAS